MAIVRAELVGGPSDGEVWDLPELRFHIEVFRTATGTGLMSPQQQRGLYELRDQSKPSDNLFKFDWKGWK